MDKAIAICLTALLLLAGCLESDDAEDAVKIVGCDDEDALNYNEDATEIQNELCSSEEDLEEAIVEFINFMAEGPDMETLDTTIGYSMEVSEVYEDESWYFMETLIVSPDGMSSNIEDSYGEMSSTESVTYFGNNIQYTKSGMDDEGNEESMELRMTHAGTFDDIVELMFNDDEDDEDDREDSEDHDDRGDDDSMDMEDDEDENPESEDYTDLFDPISATFSGFEVTDSGMTFSGMLNIEDAPFGAMEVYTNSDMEITGFSLMDVDNEDNWVKFRLLDSGEISIDESIEHHALPFALMDMSDFEDDSDDWDDMVCYDMETHTIVDIYDEDDCMDAGYMWTSMDRGDDDHDDGHGECHDTSTHENYDSNEADCEAAGHIWMGDEDREDHEDDHSKIYDGCTVSTDSEDSYYECWMNEWLDEDGDIMMSDGYDMDECEELSDSTWECEYHDAHGDHDEDMTQEDCELRGGTWEELSDSSGEYYCDFGHGEHDEDRDDMEEMVYNCMPVVDFNDGDYPAFDDSYLDDSMCGETVTDMNYTFTETTMILPAHLYYEECWVDSDNETMCDSGEIIFNSTGVWDLFVSSDSDHDHCDGDYDNDTGICVEWLGNMTHSDGYAFIIDDGEYEILIHYEFDMSTMSGYLIVMDSPEPMDLEMTFNMLDADGDGEVTLSEWSDVVNASDGPMSDEDIANMGAMLDMHDDDDSGGLNFTEFENMMHSMEEGNDDDPEYIFNMIDTDNDGEVTLTEWVDSADRSEDGEPMTDEDIDGLSVMIEMFDDDNSGGLNFAEFLNLMDMMDDDMGDDPEFVFNMIDADGDGEVTLSEWVDSSSEDGDELMSDEDIEGLSMMMDMYDDDDSGGLNLAEFMNMMDEMDRHDDDEHDSHLQFLVVVGMEDIGGSLDDYSLTLANCADLDEDENLNDLDCSADIWSMTLSDIQVIESEMMTSGLSVMYMDSDNSNTLTAGDVIMIDHSTLDVEGDWNTARLYSEEADSYADENPMLPGFTGIIATIGLLGAALLRRD